MFRNIMFSAFGAGLALCVGVSLLQAFTTEPLILHAEEFEGGAAPHDHGAATEPAAAIGGGWFAAWAHETGAAGAVEAEEWGPADGFERTAYTVLANLVIGFAASLMLLGVMIFRGGAIDARTGLLWGIGAFFALSLLPSLGLPPELPGTPAAEILDRQTWWLATAALSAAGIALIVFGRQWWMWAAGAVLIVAPHVVGAPVPPSHDVAYPGALAGEFVIASLVVSATLWIAAGTVSAWFYQRQAARN
jgi:cobalt transporter subunit CbtA